LRERVERGWTARHAFMGSTWAAGVSGTTSVSRRRGKREAREGELAVGERWGLGGGVGEGVQGESKMGEREAGRAGTERTSRSQPTLFPGRLS
jgi:hypothetical protein